MHRYHSLKQPVRIQKVTHVARMFPAPVFIRVVILPILSEVECMHALEGLAPTTARESLGRDRPGQAWRANIALHCLYSTLAAAPDLFAHAAVTLIQIGTI